VRARADVNVSYGINRFLFNFENKKRQALERIVAITLTATHLRSFFAPVEISSLRMLCRKVLPIVLIGLLLAQSRVVHSDVNGGGTCAGKFFSEIFHLISQPSYIK